MEILADILARYIPARWAMLAAWALTLAILGVLWRLFGWAFE